MVALDELHSRAITERLLELSGADQVGEKHGHQLNAVSSLKLLNLRSMRKRLVQINRSRHSRIMSREADGDKVRSAAC